MYAISSSSTGARQFNKNSIVTAEALFVCGGPGVDQQQKKMHPLAASVIGPGSQSSAHRIPTHRESWSKKCVPSLSGGNNLPESGVVVLLERGMHYETGKISSFRFTIRFRKPRTGNRFENTDQAKYVHRAHTRTARGHPRLTSMMVLFWAQRNAVFIV